MLEILLVIWLSKKLGEILEEKGYKKAWYIAMFVGSWIFCEFVMILIFIMLFSVENNLALIPVGICGGAIAYGCMYLFVNSLPEKEVEDIRGEFRLD